jgi:hypothetical protein
METTYFMAYAFVLGISIAIGHLIFNWYMQPTKELLKEQNKLLRQLVRPEEKPLMKFQNDPAPVRADKKDSSGNTWAVVLTVIVIITVIVLINQISQ